MSLKTRIPARLKALFAGVALSKKDVELITTQLSAGLTDESTDEDIDAKINARNELHSFEEQKRYSDYLSGKAKKEADDKEAKRLADIEAGKKPEDEPNPNESPMEKMLREALTGIKTLKDEIAVIKGDKVVTTRKQAAAEKLKDLPEAFRNSVLADMDDIPFRDEDHLNAYLERKATEGASLVQAESDAGLGVDAPYMGLNKGKLTAEKEVSAPMKELIAERTAKAAATKPA